MKAKGSIAIVTQVFNEDRFLPIWLNHYGKLVGYQNLIVIDDGSTDGSVSDARIEHLIKRRRVPKNEIDRATAIGFLHEELLKYYDWVVYTDCDELIVVDPEANCGLVDCLRKMNSDWVNLIGFNVLHDTENEADLDLSRSLFTQRQFVKLDIRYCKPLISRIPIQWSSGFHKSDKRPMFQKHLFLFHLRSIDYKYSCRRFQVLNGIPYSEEALQRNESIHLRRSEAEYLRSCYDILNEGIPVHRNCDLFEVFRNYLNDRQQPIPVVRIPDRFRHSVEMSAFSTDTRNDLGTPVSNIEGGALQAIYNQCIERMIFSRPRVADIICPCGSGQIFGQCHGDHSSQSHR